MSRTASSFDRTTSSRVSAWGSGRVLRRHRVRTPNRARRLCTSRNFPGLVLTKVSAVTLPGVLIVPDDLVGALSAVAARLRRTVALDRVADRDDSDRVDPLGDP